MNVRSRPLLLLLPVLLLALLLLLLVLTLPLLLMLLLAHDVKVSLLTESAQPSNSGKLGTIVRLLQLSVTKSIF